MAILQGDKTYTFKIDNDRDLILLKPEDVFTPTGTSDILVREVRKHLKEPAKVLDLGCGIGVSGLALHQVGLVKEPLYGSDIGKNAVETFILNAKRLNCQVVAKCGSIFEPWESEKFDVIIDDISGVAEQVAEISPWFNGVSCNSGKNGTNLIADVLKSANKYLNKNGILFFPIISFSNVGIIVNIANDNFKTVKRLTRNEWPLPQSMYEYKALLEKLKLEGYIDYSEKFGMIIWYTDIYIAYN